MGGKVVCYTGDVEYTDALGELVAECYFYDKPVNWHLNYPDIHRQNAKRVILTHMSTNMLAQTANVGEEFACDGYVVTV